MVENGDIVSKDLEVAETFNKYFVAFADSLGFIKNAKLLSIPRV